MEGRGEERMMGGVGDGRGEGVVKEGRRAASS